MQHLWFFLIIHSTMMKSFGSLFCVLLMGTWTASAGNTMGLYDDKGNIAASNPGFVSLQSDINIHDISSMITSRKLKDKIDYISSSNNKDNNSGKINLEDYQPINPVPSYKASIRPGPVQHGTPLMPYIPNPDSPPPSHGG